LDAQAIEEALALLEGAGAREFSENMAEAFYRKALASLEQTGMGDSALANLRDLAASLINRDT
jgi:geranylgeranyl pyrophosphate synthase